MTDLPRLTTARAFSLSALMILALAVVIPPSPATAQETADRWMVRTFVSGVVFDAGSDVLDLEAEPTVTAGADVTYFPTRHIGVNALAAFISPEIEALDESMNLGSVDALPPVLTVQYHFVREGPVQPYVGGGGSYVNFFGESGRLDDVNAEIDDGWGIAGQAGVNLFPSRRFAVIADFRWVSILNDPDVTTDLGNDELELDHAIISLGVGFSL